MAINSIEKALGGVGESIDPTLEKQEIQIEIENPEKVSIESGGLEIEIEPGKETDEEFNANLAEDIDEQELTTLSEDLLGDFEDDISSRKD